MDVNTRQPFDRMFELVCGFWVSRAIHAATRLAVPDHLADGPKTMAELAELTGCHQRSLYRLLRALAGIGIFREDSQGRFHATALGDTLRSDIPGSLASFVQMELGEHHHRAWGELVHAVRTGEPAFDKAVGTTVWQFFEENTEMARHLGQAMTGLTEMVATAVLDAYDFGPYSKLVDVGGGEGGFLIAILAAHPGATGVVFDLPHVVARGRERVTSAGLSDRCELVAGNFFEATPSGGDLYLMKWVLHDWDDEASVEILKNCRNAMGLDGRLLIVDTVIPTDDQPSPGKLIDLNMMVLSSGQERTEREFSNLLAAAGFTLTRVLPTRSPNSIVEAVPTSD